MPFYAEAMSGIIKEMTNHEIGKKNTYLLEGMPSSDLVLSDLDPTDAVSVNEHLYESGTREAVHTLLALKAFQVLIELEASHAVDEVLGNQTVAEARDQFLANQTALGNQTTS